MSAASLSTVNDVIAKRNTFDVHLTVGYAMDPVQWGAVVLESIPFLKYDRDYVSGDKAPPNANNVNNIGFGAQERLTLPLAKDLYATLTAQPQYIVSLRTNAEVMQLHLTYEVEPLMPVLGFAAPIWDSGPWAKVYARAVVNSYQVVRSAYDKSLTAGNSFMLGGIQIGGSVFVKDENSKLNGLSFPLDYTTLYGFSDPYKAIELLQVGVNYAVPKTKYVTVGLSYTKGNNLDTFEQQKVYKASLGVKY